MRIVVVAFVLSASLGVSAARTQTLGTALALAYRKNPTLLGEQANQRAITENSAQARAGWRPQVTLNSDLGYSKGPCSGVYGTSCEGNYTDAYLSAKQTLYSFGRIANQVRAADARSRAEDDNLRQTESQLFVSAITAYMDVLRDRAILDVRHADLDVLERQVRVVTSHYDLGGATGEQVTRSDVEQSETQRQSAIVAVAQAKTALAGSEATFRAVIGIDPDTLTMPDALPGMPATLAQAEAISLDGNPQLTQTRSTKKATEADIDSARAQWGPQIQLQVNYGGIGAAAPFSRHTVSEQTTGTVTLTQPLYSGDLYNSQIRQARDRDELARQNIEQARRTALQTVRTNWAAVHNGMDAIRAGTAQVRAGQTTLRGYQIEYGYGLRSTTDLLFADQNLRAAEVDLAASQHDTIVAEATLLAAIGQLQATQLLPKLAHYDADAQLVRAKTRGWEPLQTPIEALDKVGWEK